MQLEPSQHPSNPEFGNRRWLLPGVALISATVFLSFLPIHVKRELHTKGRLHSFGHFLVFGAVGFLLLRAGRSTAERSAALAVAVAFGVLIEFAEHWVYRSPVEWNDVLVDALGVFAAAVFLAMQRHLGAQVSARLTSDGNG